MNIGIGKILFELAVYKEKEEVYNKEFKKYFEKHKYSDPNANKELENKMNITLRKNFGGKWKYNQIIGYLEFYIFGNDIRCAYYQGYEKKTTRKGKKLFKIYDDSIINKVLLKNSYTNEKITKRIRGMIEDCKGQRELKKRYINTKIFDNMIQFINWKEYIKNLKETTT